MIAEEWAEVRDDARAAAKGLGLALLLLVWFVASMVAGVVAVFWAVGHVADETFGWVGIVYVLVTLFAFLAVVDDGRGRSV